MARPLSEDKRAAILEAATEVVAMLGVSAPTAKIAKGAGVAEGTLFTYFANKDELLNRLYLELKMDLRDAMMTGYPAGKSLIDRNRHVWDRFIGWGSAHPLKRRAMRQLAVSDRITEESKKLVGDAFGEFDAMMRGRWCNEAPASFIRVGDYECDRRYDDGFHRPRACTGKAPHKGRV
jgi:AcrR family transcriptional regulator